ncbi:MAG: hypothetical protein GC200_04480 [Tepidisphaera sp.]|nr:hypothetical protein [Tepidisphaera sp.]
MNITLGPRRRSLTRSLLTGLGSLVALLLAFVDPAATAQTTATNPPITTIPASRAAKNIAIITLHGEIDGQGVMAASIKRRLAMAERAAADAIVFDIDTPGGDLSSVLEICNAIKASPIKNTVAWINPNAYSGGAVVALACRDIVVNDPCAFGDAKIISGGPLGIDPRGISPEILRKIMPPLIAEVVDSARRHNAEYGNYSRDEYLVQSIVADDLPLWLARNKKTGQQMCIDQRELATFFPGEDPSGPTRLPSVPGLSASNHPTVTNAPEGEVPSGSPKLANIADQLAQLQTLPTSRPKLTKDNAADWEIVEKVTDGAGASTFKTTDMLQFGLAANDTTFVNGIPAIKPIRNDQDLAAYFGAKHILRYDSSWSEGLVLFLTNIWVRGLLIVVFLVGLFVEMTHPGILLPAAIALVALFALIAPPMLIGMAGWWEVAAIIVGILLLLLEIFVLPGFGAAGIAGLILLFVGLVATFVPYGDGLFPDSPQARSGLTYGALVVLLAIVTSGLLMWQIGRHFGSLPFLNRLVLQTGEDESDGMLLAMDPTTDAVATLGELGVALTALRPAGRIQIGERLLDASAAFGYIDAGTPVRVARVEGPWVWVEPAGDA